MVSKMHAKFFYFYFYFYYYLDFNVEKYDPNEKRWVQHSKLRKTAPKSHLSILNSEISSEGDDLDDDDDLGEDDKEDEEEEDDNDENSMAEISSNSVESQEMCELTENFNQQLKMGNN